MGKWVGALLLWALLSACTQFPRAGEPGDVASWRGIWRSGVAPIVEGRLEVELPFPLPPEGKLRAPVRIAYAPTSPFRAGESVTVEFDIRFQPGGRGLGSGARSQAAEVVVTFEGAPQVGQRIAFTASIAADAATITGQYESEEPFDVGSFSLFRQ